VNAEDDDELDDLKLCEVLLPPGMDTEVRNEVVEVHGNMNEGVQNFGDPLDWDFGLEAGPNQKEGDPMVIYVKEI